MKMKSQFKKLVFTPLKVQNEVGKCCPTHTHIHIIMHLLFESVIYMTLCRLFTKLVHTMYFYAVLQGKRAAIRTYFQEIMESIDSITDGDILDHIIAKLLPVITTIRARLDLQTQQPVQKPANFDLTFKFAPAQKNETQLRF